MWKNQRAHFILLMIALIIVPLFHNCTKFEAQKMLASASACSTDMWPLFDSTYHNFFNTNNCKSCHSENGISGIPHFADADSKKGVEVFLSLGGSAAPDVVENKLKSGHQGYSFTTLQSELDDYKKQWYDKVQNSLCSGQSTVSYSQSIDFFEPHPTAPEFNIVKTTMMDWQTLTWDMGKNHPDLQGISLSVEIKAQANEFQDPENYFVRNIKLKNPNSAMKVRKIYVLLNKKTYFVTTFSGIDNTYPASNDFQPLNDGSSAGIFVKDTGEKYANSDKWSIQIEIFEPTQ